MRTTVDIDTPPLNDLRKLQERRKAGLRKVPPPFTWNTPGGRLRVERTDADAVYAVLDADVVERQKQ